MIAYSHTFNNEEDREQLGSERGMTAVHVDGSSSYHWGACDIVSEWPDKLSIILLSCYVIINQNSSQWERQVSCSEQLLNRY